MVVVLEDLHWADPDSLALAEFAARQLHGGPVLLIGTYRDEEATGKLRHLAGSANLVSLGGLGPAEVALLMARHLGRAPDEDETRRMWDRTSGNPLFVTELTRLAAVRGVTDATGLAVPGADSVRDVIERRLARLTQDCVHTLAAASLDSQALRPALLRHALDVDVETHLEQAAAAGVLVRTGAGSGLPTTCSARCWRPGSPLTPARRCIYPLPAPWRNKSPRAGSRTRPSLPPISAQSPSPIPTLLCAPRPSASAAREAAAAATASLAFADAVACLERVLPLPTPTPRPGSTFCSNWARRGERPGADASQDHLPRRCRAGPRQGRP